MSIHKTIEVKLTEEVHALVKKMAEKGRGRGRGEPTPVTIGEMAADLISTGAFRRIAANKWAKAHAKPKKEKKPKAVKPPKEKKPKAVKPPKAKKEKTPKPPKAKKEKAPKKVKAAKSAPDTAAAAPAVDPLS